MVEKSSTAIVPPSRPIPSVADPQPRPARQPGIVLEVVEGPMDGAVLAADAEALHLGRHLQNDLSLHGDLLVSGRHARLRRTEDPQVVILEDLGSANGTWFDNAGLVAPHPIRLGSAFLVGQSVIRCSARNDDVGDRVESDLLSDEKDRLLKLFAPAMAQGYGAASMLACRERRGFVNDRHLFLGLAMNEPDLPILERGQGPIPFEFLNQMLWRNADWTGVEEWIDERLREIQIANFFTVNLPLSPRVIRSLQQAQRLAEERGRTMIEPVDWFRAVLGDPRSRPYRVLGRRQLDPDRLLAALDSTAPRSSVHPGTGPATTLSARHRATTGSPPPPQQPPRPVSTGDPTLDNQAQEIARRLNGLASLYHLAAPEDRRVAIHQLLNQEVAQLVGDRQRQLLEQVRRLFPIDAGTSHGAQEVERLNNKIAQLEHRQAELEGERPAPASGGLPWHLIVESGERNLDGLSPIERPRIEFLRQLFQFSIGVERFVVGMVQGFTAQTTSTASFALPGHRMQIRAYVDDMVAGRQVQREALRAYLNDLETWLVAGMSAYHEAPEVWFKKFWEKASPAAVEAHFSGWVKKLGVQQWEHYKSTVRTINPEMVTQKILFEVRRIAQKRQAQYAQGRQTNE